MSFTKIPIMICYVQLCSDLPVQHVVYTCLRMSGSPMHIHVYLYIVNLSQTRIVFVDNKHTIFT